MDEAWDEHEREDVALYLGWGTVVRSYLGWSECRVCGQQNGSLELTDGTYIWPEGLRHYVDVHGVRLPDEVVAHIRRRVDELEAAPVDDDWWRSLGHS